VRQSNRQTVRPSNDLIQSVATEIALFQHATGSVDEAAAALLGLNSTDLRCLGRLFLGPRTAGELAAECGLSRGAMTTALDRLERSGYAQRVRSTTDRRQVTVEMTPRAVEISDAIWGPIARSGIAELREFTEEQLSFLLDFLRRGRELQENEAERIRGMPTATADAEGRSA
jgi:DNA-binding MarR family transcriptional regulator